MLSLAFVLAAAGQAAAQFSYRQCSTGSYTFVPVDIGASEYERKTDDRTQYANLGEYAWPTYFSENVASFVPSVNDFNVEYNYDTLSLWMDTPSGAWNQTTWTGQYSDGFMPQRYYFGNSRLAVFYWHTDDRTTRQSTPHLDQLAILCRSGAARPVTFPIAPNHRVEGVLLGTGDVIYFTTYQPADQVLDISVDVLAAEPQSVDFDVYASLSTTFPDASHVDYLGYHGNATSTIGGGGEAITIPSYPSMRPVYIAVRSYSGKGHFVLHASGRLNAVTALDRTEVCVPASIGSPTTYSNWRYYVRTLQMASAYVAQMTNGARKPTWFHTLRNCSDAHCTNIPSCDAVLSAPESGTCGSGGAVRDGRIILSPITCSNYIDSWLAGRSLAHEWGHQALGLEDEYETIKWSSGDLGPFCGHTLMNGPRNSHTLCTALNHCQDPGYSEDSHRNYRPPADYDCSYRNSNWQNLADSGTVPPGAVPPPYTMADQWDSLRRNEVWLNAVSVTPP